MPYVLDLVRLAASALLGSGRRRITDEEICAAILNGYRQGLHAPQPVVLDRDKLWLPRKGAGEVLEKDGCSEGKACPRALSPAVPAATTEKNQHNDDYKNCRRVYGALQGCQL
jgi:hypothetical protein